MKKTITPPQGVLALTELGQLAEAIDALDPATMLSDVPAAIILGLEPSTLVTWRSRNLGPRFRRIGDGRKKSIRYRLSDVIEYRDRETVIPGGQSMTDSNAAAELPIEGGQARGRPTKPAPAARSGSRSRGQRRDGHA